MASKMANGNYSNLEKRHLNVFHLAFTHNSKYNILYTNS